MSRLIRTIVAAALLSASLCGAQQSTQPVLSHRSAPVLTVDGLQFKDLNRNGKLDPYEDWRLPPQLRAQDLASRMNLGEKAGVMMHGAIVLLKDATPDAYDAAAMEKLILQTHVNSFITRPGGIQLNGFLVVSRMRRQHSILYICGYHAPPTSS